MKIYVLSALKIEMFNFLNKCIEITSLFSILKKRPNDTR